MKSKILWLRLSYWIAAIADFAVAISVLIPERVGLTEFVYPMGLMSAVAFSWGILLLFADRKPLERRWILIPTVLVIALLSGVRVYASSIYLIDFSIVYLVFAVGIITLMIYSYYITRNLVTKENKK